jgi:hypothetical protein
MSTRKQSIFTNNPTESEDSAVGKLLKNRQNRIQSQPQPEPQPQPELEPEPEPVPSKKNPPTLQQFNYNKYLSNKRKASRNNRDEPTPQTFHSEPIYSNNLPHFASPEDTRWAIIDEDTGLPMTPTFGPVLRRGELRDTKMLGNIGSAANTFYGDGRNRFTEFKQPGGKKTRRRGNSKRKSNKNGKTKRRSNKNRKTKRRSTK